MYQQQEMERNNTASLSLKENSMKNIYNITSILTFIAISTLSGCGSNGDFSTSEEYGAGGDDNNSDDNGSVTNPGSDGETSTAGTGGEQSEESGTSPGGSDTLSTGGSDNSTGGMTSTGGDAGTGVCVPKTCEEIAYDFNGEFPLPMPGESGSACGVHDDGCGRNLFCDVCDSPWHECGGNISSIRVNDINADYVDYGISKGTPGICSGGCKNYGKDASCGGEKYFYTCPAEKNQNAEDGSFTRIPPELSDNDCEDLGGKGVWFCCSVKN